MAGRLKRWARGALAAGAAVVLLLASSGCLRMDLELNVRSDDTVGGSFTAAWSEEFLAEVAAGDRSIGQAELDAFVEALMEGVPDGRRSAYHEDGYLGQTASFTGRPLREFGEFGDTGWGFLSIVHEDRRYVLDGRWDLRAAGFIEADAVSEVELIIRVNFPARVTDHNGELDGRTVTWRMSPGQEYELRAEAAEYDLGRWVLVTLASLVAVLALLWLWQWTRLRKHATGRREERQSR
ncbi:hypothetical protein GCM10027447_24490 [Glycomyces halotolerans]